MRAGGAGNINEHLIDTIAQNFSVLRTIDARDVTNRVLFATNDEKLSRLMIQIAETWQTPAIGENILTADRAPVEILSMRALDNIIQAHLTYYKEIYRREGLEGVLNSFL